MNVIEPEDTGSDPSVDPKAGVRILIVDDEDVIRHLLSDVLGDEGYHVETVACGEDAVLKLREGCCDIVMTDLMMPGIGGLQVLKTVKELRPGTEVVVMTGYASMGTAIESMKLGAANYLTKPLNIDEIRISIDRLLEKRQLQQAAQEAEFYKELSRTDGLTQLYNHKFFHQMLETEISRARRYEHACSLLMIDVDNFKTYNDANGHPMGDTALQKVAWLIGECSRGGDSVARYGGEEFAVIAVETDRQGAIGLAERLRSRVEATEFQKAEVMPLGRLTVSIGVASFPTDAQDKSGLIDKADHALYQAKASGRNCVIAWDAS